MLNSNKGVASFRQTLTLSRQKSGQTTEIFQAFDNNFWVVSLLIYQNELESSKAVDITSEYVLYFNIWVSCLCTFNPLPLLLKWVMTLVGTTYRNMESRQSCRTTYMMRIKESERRPFFKFLDGILFCMIHIGQMKLW